MDNTKPTLSPLGKTMWDNITNDLKPSHLEVITEKEGHWKVIVVSESFAGKKLLQRHQLVQGSLKTQMASDIHALSIVAKTAEEWEKLQAK